MHYASHYSSMPRLPTLVHLASLRPAGQHYYLLETWLVLHEKLPIISGQSWVLAQCRRVSLMALEKDQ